MKRYQGRRQRHAPEVTVDGRPLDPRLDLCSHSPSGFEWGYGGSGPAQLALALLARLSFRGWELTGTQMETWLDIIKSRSTVEP